MKAQIILIIFIIILFHISIFRARKESEEFREQSKKSIEALQQYLDFANKYNGCKICDIPDNEIKKARESIELYENLTKKADMHQKKCDVIQKKIEENLSRRD